MNTSRIVTILEQIHPWNVALSSVRQPRLYAEVCAAQCCRQHCCQFSTSHKAINFTMKQPREGLTRRIVKKLGWLDYSRSLLKASGYFLYETVADQINYKDFFNEFQLPDTFFSWFLVTELHVWLIMVRLMLEGEEGRFVRNSMVEAMWGDIDTRIKMLASIPSSSRKEQVEEYSQQFQAAIISYDEGLQSDDKVLAGAVWRNFFQKVCDNPELVEKLVCYIRKQTKLLDEMNRENLLRRSEIKWISLQERL